MGEKVAADRFDLAARGRFRDRLHACLDALATLLAEERFHGPRDRVGMEVELCLADSDGSPRMVNAEVLGRMATRDFQSELGKFTIELNMSPRELGGGVFEDMAEELRIALRYADRMAGEFGAQVVMTGVLPTIAAEQMVPGSLSLGDRYTLLNDQIMAARGESIQLDIAGAERLTSTFDSIAPESACTSVQYHLQVTPQRFAPAWNAAQAALAAQAAVGANAPFVFGRELWHESRPIFFLQATDDRPPELAAQGVRPRTWFGERWITSALDLFEESVRYYPALLPLLGDEDPQAVLAAGGVPALGELALHNGTVYRWNRPVYAVVDGVPHLRVENRVLSTGPTVTDTIANGAFYYGLVRALADEPEPVWERLPFADAERNFDAACRHGLGARLRWPGPDGTRELPAAELIAETLLPLAAAGLDAWGVNAADRDRYLAVIEGRCRRGVTGADWQTSVYHQLVADGKDRATALKGLVRRYCELARTDTPVHDWPTQP
ncbi:glutamate--cysteine ligase [Streptomyces sp. 3MP-14]|uniref:Glutamate--cysteine ligase n=1 Tax=Streptomyces mimosae TaxID=2586635 RepID=A0A5N6A0D0_9ACTN|nr:MULTISPECIES: glutamate--cysteine ligase [Streptomyces]KAB8161985.1 glutamate--cysteine ligase [Streptomyces mimosae]KAB8173683.1 glutamate--cysteine ligase [Streptomyces sp. 3MP-14]